MKIDNNFSYNLDNEESLLNLLVYLDKLYTFCIFLGSYYFIEEKDIFNQDINSEDWKNITRITYEVICSGENEIQKKFRTEALESKLAATSLLSSYNENSYGLTNAASYLSKYIKYQKSQKLMEVDCLKAQFIKNTHLTTELMTMVRWPIFKKILERDYQNIKYRKKFYIKKEYPDISLEYIQNLLKLMGNK